MSIQGETESKCSKWREATALLKFACSLWYYSREKTFCEQVTVKKVAKKNTNTLQTGYKMDMTKKVFFTFVNQLYSR